MKSFVPITLLALVAVGCNAGISGLTPTNPIVPKATHPAFDPEATARQITFHEERVKNDPTGALGWNLLAESYASLASERDDDDAAIKAEQAARKSLSCRRNRNEAAESLLTKSLLAQHRFHDAYDEVSRAYEATPTNENLRRQRMEIQLELGLYDAFRKELPYLKSKTDPTSLVVRARWEGISGRPAEEVKILRAVVNQIDAITSLPASTVAWYRMQLGAALMRAGDYQQAKVELDRAYDLNPHSYQVCAWQSRLAAETASVKDTINWADKTSKIAKMTDVQGLAAQAYLAEGNQAKASALLEQMKKENLKNGQTMDVSAKHTHAKAMNQTRHTHDRLFAMALANLGQNLAFAHHAAEEDLQNRKDIYAYDTFAWATYRYWKLIPASVTGEGDKVLREAEQAAEKALSTGSKDPHILYHAGKVFEKSQPDRSAKLLAEAKRISPKIDKLIVNP
ncbi:MAG: hypothetical protein WCK51_07520 [Armatimonadota bacterium]